MRDILQLLRVHQYLKNLFVFVPAFFSANLFAGDYFERSASAFLIFSMVASAVYILNDIADRERDKAHPTKRNRPIASGAISAQKAAVIAGMLFILSISQAFALGTPFVLLMLFYVAINLVYSYFLKHLAIYDIMIIAVGFVIRLYAGALATGLPVTNWVVIIVFLLALFLALSKRKHDCHIYETTGKKMRPSMEGYNVIFLNAAMAISGALTIMTYILYTIDISNRGGSEYLYATVFFVVFGIFRYLQISFVENGGGEPTKTIVRDPHIIGAMGLFVTTFGYALYMF